LGFYGPVQRVVIEIKIRRGNLDTQIEEAKKQVIIYADKVKADDAHIIIFDRSKDAQWEQKIWSRVENYNYEDAGISSEHGTVKTWEIPIWGA
jgi:hypothetical protein